MTANTFPTPQASFLKPHHPPPSHLLTAIYSGDPEAAAPLHSYYAPGIEAHLRRKRPDIDLTHSALDILLDAIRHVRAEQTSSPVNLTSVVLRSTRAYLARLPRQPVLPDAPITLGLKRHAEIVSRFFSRLATVEREIVMRTYLLRQDDLTIAREMCIHPRRPAAIRTELRRLVKNRVMKVDLRPSSPTPPVLALN